MYMKTKNLRVKIENVKYVTEFFKVPVYRKEQNKLLAELYF